MAANRPPLGRILTFYSYKGGTGRSMGLANVAWILACAGRKVLVIDWDVEAPGLHRYFRPFLIDTELTSSEGLIDLVDEYASQAIRPVEPNAKPDPDWYLKYADFTDHVLSLNFEHFPQGGRIDFLPAGRQGDSYAVKVSSFNWQNLYDRLGGGAFFEAMKARARELYDYVLIDSRTGVSDTAGICSAQMPDTLVVCFTYNNQSIQGAAATARSATQIRAKLEHDAIRTQESAGNPAQSLQDTPRPYRVFPVPMRVDAGEIDRLALRQAFARTAFGGLLDHVDPTQAAEYWGAVEVPYHPFYAYEEVLSPFKDEAYNPKSLLAAFVRLCGYITDRDVTEYRLPIAPEVRQRYLDAFAETPLTAKKQRTNVREETEEEILVRGADAAIAGLDEEERTLARRVLSRLVRLGRSEEGGGYFAIRASVDDFNDREKAVCAKLARYSVVSIASEDAGPNARPSFSSAQSVSFADDRLVKVWKVLREWLESDREFLMWRQQLRSYLVDWDRSGQDVGAYLNGSLLVEAEMWAKKRLDEINTVEHAYIAASANASAKASAELNLPPERPGRQASAGSPPSAASTSEMDEELESAPRAATRAWRLPLGIGALVLAAIGIFLVFYVLQQLNRSPSPPPKSGGETTLGSTSVPSSDDGVRAAAADIARGDRARDAGDTDAAQKAYTNAAALDTKSATALLRLGGVCDGLRDFTCSTRWYEAAESRAPDDPEVAFFKGTSATLQGQYADAIRNFDRAIQADGKNPDYYFNRAVAKEGAGDVAGAIADYTKAAETGGAYAQAYLNRGRLYEKAKNRTAAIADYKAVLNLGLKTDDPNRSAAQARLNELTGSMQKSAAPPPRVAGRIVLQYKDAGDVRLVEQLYKSLMGDLFPFKVMPPEPVSGATNGDVRYFFPEDAKLAMHVKDVTETDLAHLGYRLDLSILFRSADSMPSAQRGTVEIWLPSLTRALPQNAQSAR